MVSAQVTCGGPIKRRGQAMRERCAGGDAGETHGKVDVAAARVSGHVREHGDAEAELEGDGQWTNNTN